MRAGCSLCDNARKVLATARRQVPFAYEERDVDADPDLKTLYSDEVPVVAINGVKAFKFTVDMKAFLKKLAERT